MKTITFEHTSAVLHLQQKHITPTSRDSLVGITTESAQTLHALGQEGWELVSVVPYSRGIFLSGATHALLGFFKREKAGTVA